MAAQSKKVLAVCAHVDDIQITCGGTVAKLLEAGAQVKLVFTVGFERPGQPSLGNLQKLGASVATMGVKDFVIFEDIQFNDLPLRSDELRRRLDEIMKQFKPHLVFTHHTDERLVDHEVTARTAIELAKRHSVRAIYTGEIRGCSFGFEPDVYVDISDTFERKMAALRALTPDVKPEWILPPAQEAGEVRGKQCGVKYAEAFASWPKKIVPIPIAAL